MSKKLVIVADDFGFTKGVSDGCFDALENGMLTDMSFMVDSFGSEYAAKKAKDLGIVDHIGLHVTLCDLLGTGKYLRTNDYITMLRDEPAKKLQERVKLEIKKFEDTFETYPSHLNSHHYSHSDKKLREVFAEYAQRNNVWVRKTAALKDKNAIEADNPEEVNKFYVDSGCKVTDYIFEEVESTLESAPKGFLEKLATVKDDTTTEIFFHPAIIDELTRKYTSLIDGRERDLILLKDKKFKEEIKELGFEIVKYKDL